ncbi:MAG: type I methionyl aminopeptidase [Fimbriimonadaceae bacterium]
MGVLKTAAQIDLMRESGRIIAKTLRLVSAEIKPGVTPRELDAMAESLILAEGGVPSFKGYRGYTAATCISVNEVVIHGIPDDRKLVEGDIISLDFGVVKDGWHGDSAWTYPVGEVSTEAKRLMNVTREALNQGIAKARHGNTVGDIGHAVQSYVEKNGYGVVRDFVGHGIGERLHDEPHNIAMYGKPNTGVALKNGMTICIEPMVTQGTWKVDILDDGWTVLTRDRKLAAHFEHMIAITPNGPEILTKE